MLISEFLGDSVEIHSLGYRTDLLFVRFDGRVEDRGEYIYVESPKIPTFHWGNLLLFNQAPVRGDLTRWTSVFKREFAHNPAVRHITLGWDTADGKAGDLSEFLGAGYKIEEAVVLTTKFVRPPARPNHEVRIRTLATDADWEATIQCQIAARDPMFGLEGYSSFKRAQMARYRAMVEKGLGLWYGAFLEDSLVGDLGVFIQEGVGRFQSVGTVPEHRGRGICATLVHEAARLSLRDHGARELVMVADENYHAARIYESIGFKATRKQYGVCYWKRDA